MAIQRDCLAHVQGGRDVTDVTDALAIQRSLDDPRAFSEVFERHHDHVFAHLAVRSCHDTARDLASEVFTIAFANRARYDTRYTSARPWLFGIANNLLRTHLRWRHAGKRVARPTESNEEDVEESAVWRADAEALVRSTGLVDAINQLRRDDREVLVLYALADLTYVEIAEACAIPVGTVRSKLARVRRQLTCLFDSSQKNPDIRRPTPVLAHQRAATGGD